MKKAVLWIAALVSAVSLPAQELSLPFPARSGNQIEWFCTGDDYLASLYADLNAAQSFIESEFYHLHNDEVGKTLQEIFIRKAREGVTVRMLVDGIVNSRVPKSYFYKMRKAGVEVVFYDDPDARIWELLDDVQNRTHRKIIVIDHRIGYTGGMNPIDEVREWGDIHMRVQGPVVADLHSLLDQGRSRFKGSDCPVEPAPTPAGDVTARLIVGGRADYPILERLYEQTFQSARESIWIRTPYFCPPKSILSALKAAAQRGVDVRIYLPKASDWPMVDSAGKAFFKQLLEAGVHLYYCGGAFNHAKTFVVDGTLGCAGTVNLDNRSLVINQEDGLFLYGPSALSFLLEDYARTHAGATEITKVPFAWPHRYFFLALYPWM